MDFYDTPPDDDDAPEPLDELIFNGLTAEEADRLVLHFDNPEVAEHFAHENRLHFVRWLVEKGILNELLPPPTIAQLNDAFRKSGRNIHCTPEILAQADLPAILQAVREYDAFTPDNDPYGEHDFGRIEWQQDSILWKIDYYDRAMQYWADPLSPECVRVLTVCFANEW